MGTLDFFPWAHFIYKKVFCTFCTFLFLLTKLQKFTPKNNIEYNRFLKKQFEFNTNYPQLKHNYPYFL
jgi:hypothetical protein